MTPATDQTTRPDPPLGDALLLEAEELGRRDPDPAADGAWLFRRLSLRLDAGDLVALEGPTGAGKTLLLRALAGLDPLDEGEIRIRGRLAARTSPAERRAALLYLHQSPALFPGTVLGNLREPFRFGVRRDRVFPGERADELLAMAGRPDAFRHRAVDDLSGGERQIVALVRALLTGPLVLLLDEPTAALDPGTTDVMEEMVRGWLDAGGDRGVLWVTHDREQARRVGHRRLRLAEGRLVGAPPGDVPGEPDCNAPAPGTREDP